MALPFFNWSRTAASNASADSTVNWAEGQAPSSVNDSARAMMASAAAYRDDIAGNIATGGTATAYTVTSFQVFDTLAHLHGQKIAFVPHATNTNAVGVDVTLNVDSLGAKSIRMAPSVALPNGTLVLGTPYIVSYNNTDGVFYLQNMTNPYAIPLGGGLDYWGTTAPNSSFAFPSGQAVSRTTYATLFTLFSTQYGSGDGSTTFNLPDLRGRFVAGKDDMGGSAASRLAINITGTTLGAAAGLETSTLITANLPAYTPAGSSTVSVTSTVSNVVQGATAGSSSFQSGTNSFMPLANTATSGTLTSTGTGTFTGTAQGGTSTAFNNVPPVIIANYILRII
jgi:microcystin-dependent protein